jgi:hypothetical protein
VGCEDPSEAALADEAIYGVWAYGPAQEILGFEHASFTGRVLAAKFPCCINMDDFTGLQAPAVGGYTVDSD